MFLNARGRQLVLKLCLATVVIASAVALFRWGLLPVIVAIFDLDASTTALIRRGGIFVSVVLAYWAYIRFYEKRQVKELFVSPIAMIAGALSGAAIVGLVSLFLFGIGVYKMDAYLGLNYDLFDVAMVILVAATIEEFIFRGLLFQALEQAWGSVPALLLQSLLFSVLHIANLDNQTSVVALTVTVISGTLIGVFWTLVFIQSRNLWVVSINHAAWNFTVVLTGLPLSGLDDWRTVAPFVSTYQGPEWLTGGVVGPEDSIVTVVVVLLIVIGMLVWASKTNRFLKTAYR